MFGVIEYMEGASYAFKFVDFLGTTWLGDVPYDDDPIICIKNIQEQVTRLIDASGGWKVYGVNEANGRIHRYYRAKTIGLYDVWSL